RRRVRRSVPDSGVEGRGAGVSGAGSDRAGASQHGSAAGDPRGAEVVAEAGARPLRRLGSDLLARGRGGDRAADSRRGAGRDRSERGSLRPGGCRRGGRRADRGVPGVVSVEGDLRAEFGETVLEGAPAEYLTDFTRAPGRADAVALPRTAEEVAGVLAWCYERDLPIGPRGGGTGAAAGAVPDGGVVMALDRLDRVRSFDPELWRIHVEAGVPTGRLKQVVRESGLMFAPDPGAPEQSQIGGNIATNAGGPHA